EAARRSQFQKAVMDCAVRRRATLLSEIRGARHGAGKRVRCYTISMPRRLLLTGASAALVLLVVLISRRLGAPPVAPMQVWRAATEARVVALTFDDGPNPPYTERLLD